MAQEKGDCVSPICGIIMPISKSDTLHPASHWCEVLAVFEEAIRAAGMEPKPVWIAGDSNIIQAKILKNLFENDIVLCDISTLNPNVMLEFGMRLTTRKPTVVVAETGTKPPFDTNMLHTEFYNPSLKHAAVKEFIAALTLELRDTLASVEAKSYHSFLETFTFERVEPAVVSVTADKAIDAKLDSVLAEVSRISHHVRFIDTQIVRRSIANMPEGDPPSATQGSVPLNALARIASDPRPGMDVGVRVHHQKFGNGFIAEKDGNKLEVDFDRVGRKRVMDVFVKMVTDEPFGN
jgi:hypothetical protein